MKKMMLLHCYILRLNFDTATESQRYRTDSLIVVNLISSHWFVRFLTKFPRRTRRNSKNTISIHFLWFPIVTSIFLFRQRPLLLYSWTLLFTINILMFIKLFNLTALIFGFRGSLSHRYSTEHVIRFLLKVMVYFSRWGDCHITDVFVSKKPI